MKRLIIGIVLAICLCGSVQAADTASDWTYLTHFAIGVAYDLDDFDNHSIAFASVITWKDTFNLDIGLIDFEKIEAEGTLWWQDLNPVVGISADLTKISELVPQVAPYLGWIPEWVAIGAGFYTELDEFIDMDDIDMIMYATVKWEW